MPSCTTASLRKHKLEPIYREIKKEEINLTLFEHFDRFQQVTKCRRKTDGIWTVHDIEFTDDWSSEDISLLVAQLKANAENNGFIYGAFVYGQLKGFVSVTPEFFGTVCRYLDLSHIFVSRELRRNGIGRILFEKAKEWARDRGAERLYISAHSAGESQSFYSAMGCKEAQEYNAELVQKEPCDCQLECML